jgi:hypothetical protein
MRHEKDKGREKGGDARKASMGIGDLLREK